MPQQAPSCAYLHETALQCSDTLLHMITVLCPQVLARLCCILLLQYHGTQVIQLFIIVRHNSALSRRFWRTYAAYLPPASRQTSLLFFSDAELQQLQASAIVASDS